MDTMTQMPPATSTTYATTYGDGTTICGDGCTVTRIQNEAAEPDAATASQLAEGFAKLDNFEEILKGHSVALQRLEEQGDEIQDTIVNGFEDSQNQNDEILAAMDSGFEDALIAGQDTTLAVQSGLEENAIGLRNIDNRLANPEREKRNQREAELRDLFEEFLAASNEEWVELPSRVTPIAGDKVVVKAVMNQSAAYIGKRGTHTGKSGRVDGFPEGLPGQRFDRKLLRVVLKNLNGP
jgi:hypothetical protein